MWQGCSQIVAKDLRMLLLACSHPSAALAGSVIFTLLGLSWLLLALAWQYPWVLQFLFFALPAAALFGAAGLCTTWCILQALHEYPGGILELMPSTLPRLLNLSPFELLDVLNTAIVMPMYDCIRVFLFVAVDLEEEEREEILREMSPQFRQNVFQRSVLQLLSRFLQGLLLGARRSSPSPAGEERALLSQEQEPEKPPLATEEHSSAEAREEESKRGSGRRRLAARSQSVDNLMVIIRSAEGASRRTKESHVVQKILAQKVSDSALWFSWQSARAQYDEHLGDFVDSTVSSLAAKITTPPDHLLLRVPWHVARLQLRVASSVVSVFAGRRDTSMEVPFAVRDQKKIE
ncbi:unnamed protein product [Polarella glacialis]|uniref:Transmembrane protein n=1 Tax=Polarella glacialis TaxID=89957 RepID=A0A813LYY7_POLGL|nr:unnamed protein product [Polarella glacialis]